MTPPPTPVESPTAPVVCDDCYHHPRQLAGHWGSGCEWRPPVLHRLGKGFLEGKEAKIKALERSTYGESTRHVLTEEELDALVAKQHDAEVREAHARLG